MGAIDLNSKIFGTITIGTALAGLIGFGTDFSYEWCLRRQVGFSVKDSTLQALYDAGSRTVLGERLVPHKKAAISFMYY